MATAEQRPYPEVMPAKHPKHEQRHMTLNPIQLAKDATEALAYHYREGNINWPLATYITLVHVAAIVGLFWVPAAMWQTKLWAFILWPTT